MQRDFINFVKKYYFLLFLILFVSYSLLLIIRSSFVLDGQRYFVLFDDEMISMRYAWNLAHGNGMVWNSGERVEGITNPLWTGYMTLIHLFPVPLSYTSLFIQLSGMVFLFLNLIVIRKIAFLLDKKNWVVAFLSILLTASYFPLNNWGTVLGTEVSIITLLVSLLVFFALKGYKTNQISFLFYIILFLLPWFRMDAVVPAITVFITTLFLYKNRTRHAVYGCSALILSLGTQTIGRFFYYSDFFPNTYYLKMTGYPFLLRISRGAYVTFSFLSAWYFFIPVFLILLKPKKEYFVLFIPFIFSVFYSVYIGGDAWEFFGGSNRYITPVMPLFFILLACGFYYAFTNFSKYIQRKKTYFVIGCFLVLVILISLNASNRYMFAQWLFLRSPRSNGENMVNVKIAQKVKQLTKKDAVVGVVWAGVIPYFSQRTSIDLLGKNDKYIAHRSGHVALGGWQQYIGFLPGHTKWDSKYSLSKHPDMLAQIYPVEEMREMVKTKYDKAVVEGLEFYILKGSKKINRAALPVTQQ